MDSFLRKKLIKLKKSKNEMEVTIKVDCFGVDYGNITCKVVTSKYNLYKQTLS